MKLSTKLLLPILGVVTAGLFVALLLSYFLSAQAFESASADSQRMAIINMKKDLEAGLAFNIANAVSLSQTAALQPYLSDNEDERQASAQTVRERLANMRDTYAYVELGVLDAQGLCLMHTNPDAIGRNFASEPAFQEAAQGMVGVGLPFRLGAMAVYAVAAPVRDPRGAVLGVVFTLSRLEDTLTQRLFLGNRGYVMVAASDGTVFIHTDPAKALNLNIGDETWGSRMLAERSGTMEFTDEGAEKIAHFDTIAPAGWLAAAVTDMEELLSPVSEIRDNSLFIAAVVLCVVALVVFAVVRSVVASLQKTVEYARQVAGGALDQELHLRSRDEVGILADSLRSMVTTLREMLAHGQAQQQALEAASQHKTEFLASMSHEIRTPMNAITGFTALFRKDNLDSRQLDYLQKIAAASNTMLQIVNDILDLSKIEKGKLAIEHIPFVLEDIIGSISGVIGFTAKSKGCDFRVEIAPNVPQSVVGDPTRVQQVLFNLLGNAVKFTTQGAVTLSVSVASRQDATAEAPASAVLLFEVRDTGIGISPEQLARLFNPFEQADATISRKYGGTGLGLIICQKLVDLMGGDIGVESTHGVGTTFRFTIAVTLPVGRGAEPGSGQDAASEYTLSHCRVLVVEDNEINLEIICALMESFGITNMATAANGQEALDQVGEEPFHVILMDMQMPVMDGLTATRRLRALGAEGHIPWLCHVPIVALTANALNTDVDRCLQAGMNAHISKPIVPEVLRTVLLEHCGK